MDDQSEIHLDRAQLLEAEFDPRLADVWASIFASDTDTKDFEESLSWFLRMAYLRGYEDALTEEEQGCLFKSLGMAPPRRPSPRVRNPRPKGGRR